MSENLLHKLWKKFTQWRYLRLVEKVDRLYLKEYGKTRLEAIIEEKGLEELKRSVK